MHFLYSTDYYNVGLVNSLQDTFIMHVNATILTLTSYCESKQLKSMWNTAVGDDLVAAARFHHRVTVLRSHVESSERNPSVDARQTTDAAPSAARVIPQPDVRAVSPALV